MNKEISTVMKSRKGKTQIQFLKIIRSFNSIHNEIKEFNENYWSEYLFLLLSTIMTISNAYLYLWLFGELNIISRSSFLFTSILFSMILLLILLIASSVSSEAKKSYKLLNAFYVQTIKIRISIHMRIKVCLILWLF